MATVRRELRIHQSADAVWAVLGDPVTIAEWFPGIASATVDGTTRVITTASGLPMPEEILVNDPILRRFQYRLDAPIAEFHRGTIDVFDLHDGTCLVSYATDAVPDAMALIIGGATGPALEGIARVVDERVAQSQIDEHDEHEHEHDEHDKTED